MEMNFCRRCGTPLITDDGHTFKCKSGHTLYVNSAPCISVFFISEDNSKVLLATRGREPFKGKLDGPGGFLDANESFIDAAHRELNEELGISPTEYEPLHYLSEGFVEYPFADEITPIAGLGYWSRLKPGATLKALDDVVAVNWYDLHTINLDDLSAQDSKNGIMALRTLFPKEDL